MKKNYVLGIAALSAVVLLAGCGNKELTPTEYCEQNGGVSSEGICLFEDGSYCAEDAYAKGECQSGEIIYNTVDENEFVVEEENVEENTVEDGEPEEEVAVDEESTNEVEVEDVVEEEAVEEAVEEVAE